MKQRLSGWMAKYDALALSERRLITVAVLGGVLLIGWSAFFDPAWSRLRLAERGIVDQRAQLAALGAQAAVLKSPAQNPENRARTELAALKAQLNQLNDRLAKMESALVPPQHMPELLEEIIGHRGGLYLISLHTVSAKPLLEKTEAAESAPASKAGAGGLYKHGVEIKLEGSYADLAAYLARLEKSPQKMLWSSATLSAEKHPRLVLTLTVFTLSLDRTWLVV